MSDLILRPHRPGDLGWAVHRQAVLYHREYGWSIAFEGMLAEIAASFIRDFDPDKECARVAERDGVILGAIFVVRQDDAVAKIRMLFVEPAARGQGIGRELVAAAIAFARATGYARITLWTNDVLLAARGIYLKAGFRLVHSEPHRSFGHDLVGENWELDLTP